MHGAVPTLLLRQTVYHPNLNLFFWDPEAIDFGGLDGPGSPRSNCALPFGVVSGAPGAVQTPKHKLLLGPRQKQVFIWMVLKPPRAAQTPKMTDFPLKNKDFWVPDKRSFFMPPDPSQRDGSRWRW